MQALIKIKNINKDYFYKKNKISALKNINLDFYKNEIVGLVGESGSGKSTLAKILTSLVKPTSGQIFFKDELISSKKINPKEIQMIFQNPFSSFNPRMKIEEILKEPIFIHNICQKDNYKKYLKELLFKVSLSENTLKYYPHQLSVGQLQRIAIARAISLNPSFLICDEAVSSLDSSIQMQVINLLKNLHKTLKITLLFISHDLSVIKNISTKVCVMYKGEIVENQMTDIIFNNPCHTYTKSLLKAAFNEDYLHEKNLKEEGKKLFLQYN